MAVPAGDERGPEASHGLRLDDHVLEDFVQGLAEMNVAGGIGRAIVQDVDRSAGARRKNAFVEPRLLPPGQPFRLALGQVCLHGEGSPRQIQGLLEVQGFRHGVSGKAVWSRPLPNGCMLQCQRKCCQHCETKTPRRGISVYAAGNLTRGGSSGTGAIREWLRCCRFRIETGAGRSAVPRPWRLKSRNRPQ